MTDSVSNRPAGRAFGAAYLVCAVIGAWILAGAAFKLFLGSPNDLPPVVKDVPLAIGLTYRLAIAIELVFACLAFLKPRWAWPLLVAQLLVFDAILFSQLRAGSESCGCFGSKVPITPATMMAIDSVLLVGLLLTRPWRTLTAKGAPAAVVLIACAALFAMPWLLNREVEPDLQPVRPSATAAMTPEGGGGDAPATTPAPPATSKGGWVQLDIESWVGKDLGETPLANWIDVYSLPPDALWVVYRMTCDHCAEHLDLLTDQEVGQRDLVLLRLKEKHDTDENRVVHRVPEGDFVFEAELPDTVDYVITTPGEMVVAGFRIVEATEGADTH